jgi:NAD(P)-dependent dehydrogenase (short-subunit alcohol dehydrogenase family)
MTAPHAAVDGTPARIKGESSMDRLTGKVAVVTGTSRNIGGAVARCFAAEGARVACTDIDPAVAEECAAAIVAAGGEALSFSGDVTDSAHAAQLMDSVAGAWGGVDILVNNAVRFDTRGLLTMDLESYRRQLDVILAGAFLFSRAAAQDMIRRNSGGSIINVLSTAAWQGQPGNIGYCTAKSGLINFTRSAAMELAPYRIRVNGFTPTATQPEDPELILRREERVRTATSEYRMDFELLSPLGRLPTPSDYLPAMVLLASDESAMITGSNITVDGGATAKYWPWIPARAQS